MAKDKHRQVFVGLATVEISTGQGAVKRLSNLHPIVKKDLRTDGRNDAERVLDPARVTISIHDIARLIVLLGRFGVVRRQEMFQRPGYSVTPRLVTHITILGEHGFLDHWNSIVRRGNAPGKLA